MIFAVDVGSSLLKAGLVQADGRLAVIHKIPVRFSQESWLAGLKEAFSLCSPHHNRIEAIAICGNGPTLVPAARDGNIVAAPLPWFDTRATRYLDEIALRIGKTVDPAYYLARAYLLFKEQPAVYEQTAWFLPCPEYLAFFLTDKPCAIRYCRGAERYLWNDEAVARLGMEQSKFPPFADLGSITGRVTERAACSLGIPAGIPVIACGTDFLMALIGTDTLAPGKICDRAGTSEGLNLCTTTPLEGLKVMPHLVPGWWNASGLLPAAGKALEWVKEEAGLGALDYPALLEQAVVVLPDPGNPRFFPLPAPAFTGLKPRHTAAHKVRAVLEATGFAMLDILRLMEKQVPALQSITVCGSLAASAAWNQLRADLFGRSLSQPVVTAAELTGAACVACTALGRYPDLQSAAGILVHIGKNFTPQPGAEIYQELFALYREEKMKIAGSIPGSV